MKQLINSFFKKYCVALILLLAACQAPEQGISPYSPENELITFSFLKVNNPSLDKDYQATFDGKTITVEIPKSANIQSLVPSFKISEKATMIVGTTLIESDKTQIDFSKTPSIIVVAQNKDINEYYPSVILIGVNRDPQANSKTSYYNYISNKLYIDLSTAIPKTIFDISYFEDAYNARAYGDFDKDGDLDIITAASNAYGTETVSLEYFRNEVFKFQKDQSVFNNGAPKMMNARKAIVADLDGNGWLDVVFVGSGFDRTPYTGETIKVLMNFSGKFTAKDMNIGNGYFASVTAGDIDNDGDIDLFVTDNKKISRFLINDGSGNFREDQTIYPSDLWGKAYFSSELYDINNDGYLDLVTGGHEHNGAITMILLGNATGNFATSRLIKIPEVPGFGVVVGISFIDYNKDGKPDLLINRTGDGKGEQGYYKGYYLQLLRNNGNTFEDVTPTNLVNGADKGAKRWLNMVRIHDIDNDGDLDITSDDKLYKLLWINNSGVFTKALN